MFWRSHCGRRQSFVFNFHPAAARVHLNKTRLAVIRIVREDRSSARCKWSGENKAGSSETDGGISNSPDEARRKSGLVKKEQKKKPLKKKNNKNEKEKIGPPPSGPSTRPPLEFEPQPQQRERLAGHLYKTGQDFRAPSVARCRVRAHQVLSAFHQTLSSLGPCFRFVGRRLLTSTLETRQLSRFHSVTVRAN